MDRSTKATLTLTIPGCKIKSSAKDSTGSVGEIAIERKPHAKLGRSLFLCMSRRTQTKHCLTSMDSDLEAFSRYPTDGSVAALAYQPTAFAKYLNEVFLSY